MESIDPMDHKTPHLEHVGLMVHWNSDLEPVGPIPAQPCLTLEPRVVATKHHNVYASLVPIAAQSSAPAEIVYTGIRAHAPAETG